ncbi:type II toxin-antitoxin system prevent-host-death family antitoxin [Scytonema sp. UIC 10036]|uniref:type II toxin-antitoxin system Phd/YefM family antitoxin n=1 Tax=Scytonema sp. UIC 10036 TaxID=2304196 RepID=UPI0012DA2F13|nr:type II toxin-antitoxin system Phd/YefM family antitoxin [Scytonema sp. UIC 10036]MUG97668.1 type II toxin-antitoxin system prevent-host-death family antitoxin [Scytonema sp. UIC 10036]
MSMTRNSTLMLSLTLFVKSHTPVIITGNQNQAVLISLEDWNAIQETLYLLQVPGMREDLVES